MSESEKSLIKQDSSDEEFEQLLKENYQDFQQNKKSSRSNSSNSRPQSANRYRPDSSSIGSLRVIYGKIQTFITQQYITATNFKIAVGEVINNARELFEGLMKLNLFLTEKECELIITQHQTPFYSKNFYNFIKEWSSESPQVAERNDKKSQHKHLEDFRIRPMSQGLQKKRFQKFQKGQKSNSPQRKERIDMNELNKDLEGLLKKELELSGKQTIGNPRAKVFLNETKKKMKEQEMKIISAADKYRREFEYDTLHKMGEANEITQALGSQYTFRALKDADGTTWCHIYKGDKLHKKIALETFLREWRRLKRCQNFEQIHKQITRPVSAQKINKTERQNELKLVLQDTIELTEKLRDQLKVLEKKGVAFPKYSDEVIF